MTQHTDVAGPSGYGPKVTVRRSCSDCKACNSESYAVQGDSGHYVYCEHPSLPERKYIGDTRWDTPGWCPVAAPTTQPAPQQEAQEPCPTCIALARTVMLDQVSFDRKPDCYGIRQITDDEGVEEWEDIRTSPDVAREEANDMMATGRGEIYEVVPLWTTPQSTQAQAEPKSGAKSFQTYGEANAYSKGYYAGKKAATQAQAQAGAVPLTDEQIEAAAPEYSVDDFLDFNAGVRFAERHHGIKGGQHGL